jgi:hypothetical protein
MAPSTFYIESWQIFFPPRPPRLAKLNQLRKKHEHEFLIRRGAEGKNGIERGVKK